MNNNNFKSTKTPETFEQHMQKFDELLRKINKSHGSPLSGAQVQNFINNEIEEYIDSELRKELRKEGK